MPLIAAKDRVKRGEIAEGCEVSSNGFRFYMGRYFGQIGSKEQEEHSRHEFRPSNPVLPYIVSSQVGRMPDQKRPIPSVICTVGLDDILTNFLCKPRREENFAEGFWSWHKAK
jgi:hypothetical protein